MSSEADGTLDGVVRWRDAADGEAATRSATSFSLSEVESSLADEGDESTTNPSFPIPRLDDCRELTVEMLVRTGALPFVGVTESITSLCSDCRDLFDVEGEEEDLVERVAGVSSS